MYTHVTMNIKNNFLVPDHVWKTSAIKTFARCVGALCLLMSVMIGPANAASWIDAVGRTIELAEPPQRIVSLVPAVTEILYALGQEKQVVGVTSFCDYPAETKQKPRVGGYADPNLEAILLQQPDLVLLDAAISSPALLAQLERLGLTVYVVNPHGLQETVELLRRMGQITGAPATGEQLAGQLEEAIARARQVGQRCAHPRVLFCVMDQPLVVAGPNTLVDDLISVAGGENLVPVGRNRYPTWGNEALLLADPDIILMSIMNNQVDSSARFADLPELTAIRQGRVYHLNPDLVLRPGPRLVQGLKLLVKALHGVDLDSVSVQDDQCASNL